MTPITFKRYSPSGSDPTIVAERITHWYQVDYNGNYGTCVILDTGKEVNVGDWPQEVEQKVRAAMKDKS